MADGKSLKGIELLRSWHRERRLQAFALRADTLAGVTLDILLFSPVASEAPLARCVVFGMAGTGVQCASVDDLIAWYRGANRPVDLADIAHLRRLGTDRKAAAPPPPKPLLP